MKTEPRNPTLVGRYGTATPSDADSRAGLELVKAIGLPAACAELGVSSKTLLRIIAAQPTREFTLTQLRSQLARARFRAA